VTPFPSAQPEGAEPRERPPKPIRSVEVQLIMPPRRAVRQWPKAEIKHININMPAIRVDNDCSQSERQAR